ncbi:MAG: AMP-dependent synthetase/ligase [Bacteroidales bacterium]
MEITRIFDILQYNKDEYDSTNEVFANKINGEWRKYNILEYIDLAEDISFGLLSLKVKKGDKIAIISSNCPEWNFIDMGIMQIGAIPIPIFPGISESDYTYIFNHSKVSIVFCEGEELIQKIEHILPEIASIKQIFTFEKTNNYKNLKQLIQVGKENAQPLLLEEIKASIQAEDLATIVYTSGTTGKQKGVMLTHANIISNLFEVSFISPAKFGDKALSFLPLCHAYERILNYMYQYLGISVYYAENISSIAENILEIQPGIFSTVPRLMEKIYDKIIDKGRNLKWFQRQIFFWAVNLGHNYELDIKPRFFYNFQLMIANHLIFNKWRDALGGKLKVIVSGGATLQPRLARIYTAAGIPILEGYGLTETSPVICVNTFFKNGRKFGTVGPPLPSIKLRINDDGEVLCKGPNVMKGYYNEPELTKEAIDENGWFHTGDTGIIEETGQLRLIGRKKTMFKTSNGKYVNPELIEEKLKESPFIDNIIVMGENQKFAAALIVPDFIHFKSWCVIKAYKFPEANEMINSSIIRDRIQREVDKYNKYFGDAEQIKKFEIIDFEWTAKTGELTPTLKLKRNFINEKYKNNIEKVFNSL